MKSNMSLGDRMKRYERVSEWILPRRIPVIIRIDGRAFHTFTKKYFGRNYNRIFGIVMEWTALEVFKSIQGCSFAYGQSDEVSFLLTDYRTINTEAHFGYDARKLISVCASVASAKLTSVMLNNKDKFKLEYNPNKDVISFDARAFSVPQDEVCNYFIWRQQDATRNAIESAGREYFSHKQLHKKSYNEIQDMLLKEYGVNFNNYPIVRKRGYCIDSNDSVTNSSPIFSKDREYIEKHVYIRRD